MTDLGVVDPLRPPASVVAFGTRLHVLPPYAVGFLGVFIARAIADLYQVFLLDRAFAPLSMYGLILGSLPDWLALLAPVAVGWGIVRSGAASPRVVGGAIAAGLSEVVSMGAGVIGFIGPDDSVFVLSGFLRMASFLLLAGGLLWMARGLETLRTGTPSAAARRAALLAIAVGLAVAALDLFGRVTQILSFNSADFADAGQAGILIANVMGLSYVLVPLAWAFIAWVLLRSGVDDGRPARAIRFGSWAGWLAIIWLGVSLAELALLPFATQQSLAAGEQTMLGAIAYVLAVSGAAMALAGIAALVTGLASGLATEPVPAPPEQGIEPGL